MPQDVFSGREGNESGKRIAKEVASFLGVGLNEGSNECNYNGTLSVIKSAKYSNDGFGITNSMLKRLEQIILVKQHKKEEPFHIYILPVDKLKPFGRDTKSKTSIGKVTVFSIRKALEFATDIGAIKL